MNKEKEPELTHEQEIFKERSEEIVTRLELLGGMVKHYVDNGLDCPLETACDIVHEIQWGIANLALRTLILRAEKAQRSITPSD